MATYVFKGKAASYPYNYQGAVAINEEIDVVDLMANPDKLALSSAPNVGLSAFAGFVQNDTLRIPVPKGFFCTDFAIYVTNTQATTLDIGDADSATQFLSNGSLASAVAVVSAATPKLYIADSYILVTFDQAVTYNSFAFNLLAAGFLADI